MQVFIHRMFTYTEESYMIGVHVDIVGLTLFATDNVNLFLQDADQLNLMLVNQVIISYATANLVLMLHFAITLIN